MESAMKLASKEAFWKFGLVLSTVNSHVRCSYYKF